MSHTFPCHKQGRCQTLTVQSRPRCPEVMAAVPPSPANSCRQQTFPGRLFLPSLEGENRGTRRGADPSSFPALSPLAAPSQRRPDTMEAMAALELGQPIVPGCGCSPLRAHGMLLAAPEKPFAGLGSPAAQARPWEGIFSLADH